MHTLESLFYTITDVTVEVSSALKDQGKKALLVGINKYHDTKLADLRFAVNDVSSVYDVLTASDRGGFPLDKCLLLTDKSQGNLRPTRSNLLSYITSLSETAKPNDNLLLFFSGHGIEEEGESYLLPSDARINVLRDTAVSIDWIKTKLKDSKAHSKVLILDACHAGAMKGKAESGRMTKGLHDALFPPMQGFAVLSSCKLHEVSYEMPEKKHGVFSYFLVEGLQGAADFDSDGHIMVSDASRYTAEKTMDWSFKEGVQQTPNLEYNVVGDLVLVDVPHPESKKAKVPVEKALRESDIHTPNLKVILLLDDKGKTWGQELCTSLTEYFELHEIKHSRDGYVFPIGNYSEGVLRFEYSEGKKALVDSIIEKLSKSMANKVSLVYYMFERPLSIKRVGKVYKSLKLRVIAFDPSAEEFLHAQWNSTDEEMQAELVFCNTQNKGSSHIRIIIAKRNIRAFKEFAQPKKFLRSIGDVWVQ